MKKIFIILFAFALCVGMNSCIKETKEAPEQLVEGATEEIPSLSDLVEKAKAESANWSVEEWKEQFKNMLLAIKPMKVEQDEITKKLGGDPSKEEELKQATEEIEKKYPNFNELIAEFKTLASATENGRLVIDDEEWGDNIMEELGVPNI